MSLGQFVGLVVCGAVFCFIGYCIGHSKGRKGDPLFPFQKKTGKVAAFLFLLLLVPGLAVAATATWSLPTTYTDNSSIAPADISRITSTLYYGSSSTGPWTMITTTAAGATSATVPVGPPGTTRYFTAEANLDGQTSNKGVPYAYTTPFKVPAVPGGMIITP